MMKKKNSILGKYEGFSEKKYEKIGVRSLYVPGTDGTKLALDVVYPMDENCKQAEGKFPAIMLVSRGGRYHRSKWEDGPNIIGHCVPYGYIGLVPEIRGGGVSYGTCNSFASLTDRQDVNAIINWVIEQPWSDGQVAIYGGSNRGLIQFATAVAKPAPSKGLKGITPVVANADFYYQDYPNGVSAIPSRMRKRIKPREETPKTKEQFLAGVDPVDDDPSGDQAYEAYMTDQYGKNMNFVASLLLDNMCRDDGNPNFVSEAFPTGEPTNITIPPVTDLAVFQQTDIRVHQFAGLIESGTFGQLMAAKEWGGSICVGPWDHFQSRRGNPDLPEGDFDFLSEHLKWFDNLMKGVNNGFDQAPPFAYYMMHAADGAHWRYSDSWPVQNVKPVKFYLSSEKSGTAASINDGTLSLVKPQTATVTDYQVDISTAAFVDDDGHFMDRMILYWNGNMAPNVDNKGLTFTTAPLFARYTNEVVGCPSVDLWVTCTDKDADFLAYLEEVLPNGESHYISMGVIRASSRTSQPREAWNECGATYHPSMRADVEKCLEEGMDQPVHLQFHIEPVMYTFQKNSCVRLTITCADENVFQHPYDKNNLPTVSLYQGADYPSFVTIPFIEHEENVYNGTIEKDDYKGPGTIYFYNANTYVYYNGIWEKYPAGDLEWELEDGKAIFNKGFTFVLEGRPIHDGIIQDYQGGAAIEIPFPVKRHQVVGTAPIEVDPLRLYVPMEKTIYVEEFARNWKKSDALRPCVLYMHGYSGTPSGMAPLQKTMVDEGYIVIGLDMRNYPPNKFPDYLQDEKGCVRYIRAHANEFGIDPDRIGVSGMSLGGNGLLALAATGGCDARLEGNVGGNLEYSSRVQAALIGYGWAELLTMGQDLIDQRIDRPESVRRAAFNNTNGPMAPAGAVIGFTGPGKGLQVLIDYKNAKEAGDVSKYENIEELDAMLQAALQASPLTHIGPDMPPTAVYGGIGDDGIDIALRQSYRTLDILGHYRVDCDLFANSNGRYGKKPEMIIGMLAFLKRYLLDGSVVKRTVSIPGSNKVVEDSVDRILDKAPVICREGVFYVDAAYVKTRWNTELTAGADGYAKADNLTGTGIGLLYFEEKNTAVILPESEMPVLPEDRT